MRGLVAIAIVMAGGGGGTGTDCHLTADCDPGLGCLAPRQECSTDTDCPGARCHAIFDSCSPDGIGWECRPACAGDGECGGSDFHCDAGACVAVSCDAGYTCPARQVCDPSRITAATPVFDRPHGCFNVACTGD